MSSETFDLAAVNVTDEEPLTSAQLFELVTASGLPEYPGNAQVVVQSELLLYYDLPRVQLHCLRQAIGGDVVVLQRNVDEQDGVLVYGFTQVSAAEAEQILDADDVHMFWDKLNALSPRPCVVTVDGPGPDEQLVQHIAVFDDVAGVLPEPRLLSAWVGTLPDVDLRLA